jgi:serine phosphatase RsbU (regulator of sigma subunit)/HAMP domain-containing protein
MDFKFTIGRRIGIGFAIFIIGTMVAFILTIITLNDSKTRTENVVSQITPSVADLKEINLLLQRSHTDISKWFYNKSFNDVEFRKEIKRIIEKDYPTKKNHLIVLSAIWTPNENQKLKVLFNQIEALFVIYKEDIMQQLSTADAYEDPTIYMMARLPFEESETNIQAIYKNLNDLISIKQKFAELEIKTMFSSLDFLKRFVQLLGITLVIGGVLIAFFTTRSITKPIQILKKMLLSMGLGILPKERITESRDEIGEMGKALNDLIQSMHHTTDFAYETGAGNFQATYIPLSKDDSLGQALLKMREGLAESERILEQKVIERTEEVVRQRHIVEEKHKEITDSINYAERIQRSFLATKELLDENLKDHFVFFKPKDIVSGDFYFAEKLTNNSFLLATADSTGHGVPGAIMSLLNITSLEKAIENQDQPSDILNTTRKIIIERLKNDGSAEGGKDGMDCSVICFDFKKKKIIVSAANNPVWIVRGSETIEIKPDKMPVGKHDKQDVSFTQQTIDIKKGDVIYTLTDGFSDQFGGSLGKKFMSKKLRELLSKNAHLPMEEQRTILENTFISWVGDLEQIDDVTLIGVRV